VIGWNQSQKVRGLQYWAIAAKTEKELCQSVCDTASVYVIWQLEINCVKMEDVGNVLDILPPPL